MSLTLGVAGVILAIKTHVDVHFLLIFGVCAAVFLAEHALLGRTFSINELTVPSLFLLAYIVSTSLPSIAVIVDPKKPMGFVGGRSLYLPRLSPEMKYSYFLAVQSVLVTFPLGVSLANLLFKNPKSILENYHRSPLQKSLSDLKFAQVFIAMAAALPALLLPYFVSVKHIQLFEVIRAYPTPIDPLTLRMAEASAPKLAQVGFEIARRFVLPVCALYTYLMGRIYGGAWKLLLWAFFGVALTVSALTLDRAEPVSLLVMIILADILSRKLTIAQAIRSPRLVAIFASAVAVGAIISVAQYQREFTTGRVLDHLWRVLSVRMTADAANMTSWAFRIFTRPSLFLHFKYERIFSFLPGFKYVEWNERRFFVTAPLAFVGNLWENWGWPAVITGSILTGFVYQLIQLSAFRRKTAALLAVQVVVLVGAAWAVFGKILSVVSVAVVLIGVTMAYFLREGGPQTRSNPPEGLLPPAPVPRGLPLLGHH